MAGRNPQELFIGTAIILVLIVFIIFSVLTSLNLYLAYLAAINIITFIFYAYDKFTAAAKFGRIPNLVLHLLSVFGGFIGGILGMAIFRHKTNQNTFILILTFSALLHLILINFLFPQLLQQLF